VCDDITVVFIRRDDATYHVHLVDDISYTSLPAAYTHNVYMVHAERVTSPGLTAAQH
jgi:hypothetical protein